MKNRSILISGIGISGPTLAYWLDTRGFRPTLVERAPTLRSGGYIIDFWGLGYDIAERMGLLPALKAEGYDIVSFGSSMIAGGVSAVSASTSSARLRAAAISV